MEERLEQPTALSEFEANHPARARAWAWIALACWALVLLGDWGLRFRRFRWQDQWMPVRAAPSATASPAGAKAAARVRSVPAQPAGILAQMVPVRRIADRYAEELPAHVQHVDEWGYFNPPFPGVDGYRVVFLGDSVLVARGTQTLVQAVATLAGLPMYNHGRAGSGPFLEMIRFLASDRFERFPDVVVWNLSARELGAPLFERQPIGSWFEPNVRAHPLLVPRAYGMRWNALAPAALGKAWPDTSAMAYFARRAWSRIKLAVLQSWADDVVGETDPLQGPMLFYRPNLEVLTQLEQERDAPVVISKVLEAAEGFRRKGAHLVVLLVPEKEQVHVRAFSPERQEALDRAATMMETIERGLEDNGVAAINLLPPFLDATLRGQRLFWRDDTHWNDAGIQLAAEEIWRTLEPLLP